MEPITHFLVGACIGRAGFNRKTAAATMVATLAAEAADLDVLWGLKGPVDELKHHRGITHTLIGAPLVAAVVVGIVGGFYVWRQRRRPHTEKTLRSGPPLRWGWLCLTALVAAFSHILLDWTNNYGIRLFFPFNPRWYEGSFMFIAEPLLWALFVLALVVPWLLGLADREIGAKRTVFRGRAWAIVALVGMVAVWGWRWNEHAQGTLLVQNTYITSDPIQRIALEPYPVNPWRWHAIIETPGYFQTAEVDMLKGSVESNPHSDVIYKPEYSPVIQAAKQTYLGQVYQDWSSWPLVRDLGQSPVPAMEPPNLPKGQTWTTVEFTDLRFAYSFRGTGEKRPPSGLSGWVYIVNGHDEAGQALGDREQE